METIGDPGEEAQVRGKQLCKFFLYFYQTQKVKCIIHVWTEAVSQQAAIPENILYLYICICFALVSLNSSDSLISGCCSLQGFVIELLLTLESGIDTLADTVKNYDLLSALAQ